MSIEYYPIPKGKVTFGQIKTDIENGRVKGLTIYKGIEKPQLGEFYVDDLKGNTLGVFKVDGVTFVEYSQASNDASGILQKLMKHYGLKIQVEGDDEVYGVEDMGEEVIVGDGKFNAVPVDFADTFKNGTWAKQIKRKKTCSKVGRIK